MGRLDDIIERNKNPKTSFRKPRAADSSRSESSASKASGDDDEARSTGPGEGADDKPGEGRLARIIARNQRANTGMRRGKRLEVSSEKPAIAGEADPAVNRLDKIIARNRKPNANYRWLKVGLAGVVLFVALILLIFTDLAAPPQAAYPTAAPVEKPSGVGGVKLWKQPKKKSDTGSARQPSAPK